MEARVGILLKHQLTMNQKWNFNILLQVLWKTYCEKSLKRYMQ